MKIKIITIILITIIFPNKIFANTKFFQQGLDLYNEKKYNEAKFKFEQDLVINPKSEMSYLYLSKIFKNLDKKNLEEQNLNSVILLNPKNEEALYLLITKKIKDADYDFAREKYEIFSKYCSKLCSKKSEIDRLIKKSKS